MVNSVDFSNRIQKMLDYYELSAAAFADSIDVGRSSISHILSGRNKPSLDFVLKVVQAFPEVELYWLLNGKGNFPATGAKTSNSQIENTSRKDITAKQTPPEKEENTPLPGIKQSVGGKEINKIVIFYVDGTFEAFEN